MRAALAVCSFLAAVPVWAQVESITLGVHSSCPYGLTAWWPSVHAALVRLDGVTDICPQPDPETWTCRAIPRGGRLPDVAAIERAVKGAGDQFSLRGVEVEAVGVVSGLELRLDGTGERIRLLPLSHRVEWSFRAQRAPPISDEERDAYERLKTAARNPLRVRLTGTLFNGALEVRRFTASSRPLP